MREPEHEFKSKREQIPEQERQRILTDLLRVVNKPEKEETPRPEDWYMRGV